MSFGFSLDGIITCCKFAKDIYDNCFTREQAADVEFSQFRQDIYSLGRNLEGLKQIIEDAQEAREQQWKLRPWLPKNQIFGPGADELPQITGDFHKTLKDCEEFLTKNSWLKDVRANPIDSARWWASAKGEANTLRERLKFHMLKIQFISEPFRYQILLEIRDELKRLGVGMKSLRQEIIELRKDIKEHFEDKERTTTSSNLLEMPIPEALIDKFVKSAYDRKPKIVGSDEDWPLKEGLDALAINFSRSTFEFHTARKYGRQTPTAPQYLNLLKSLWIWRQIQESSHFRVCVRESLWADYMMEMQGNIYTQLQRFSEDELVQPPDDIVNHLPDSCFAIWLDERPPPPPPLAMPEKGEETILELALAEDDPSRQTTLTVLRRNPVKFRFVQTTRIENDTVPARERDFPIDMEISRLIPIYAKPSAAGSSNLKLGIYDKDGAFPLQPPLRSAADLKSLQHALTGYRVQFHAAAVSWRINGSRKESDSGNGKLQLWQPKLMAKLSNPLQDTPATRDPSVAAPDSVPGFEQMPNFNEGPKVSPGFSKNSTQVGNSKVQSRKTSSDIAAPGESYKSSSSDGWPLSKEISRMTMKSQNTHAFQVTGQKSKGTEIVRPQNPMLIIFTSYQGRLTFLRVELDRDFTLNPQSCQCHKSPNSCSEVVLEHKKQKSFVLQKFSADDDALHSWDLAVFRYPRHPQYGRVETLKPIKYLTLDFQSAKKRIEFVADLDELFQIRDLHYRESMAAYSRPTLTP